jgi:hypothetical protein
MFSNGYDCLVVRAAPLKQASEIHDATAEPIQLANNKPVPPVKQFGISEIWPKVFTLEWGHAAFDVKVNCVRYDIMTME